MNLFTERFLPLIEKSGKTDIELEKAMELPRSIIYDWRTGRNKSSYKKYASNFAAYFNVSTDYLLGNTDNPQNPKGDVDPETAEAMELFKKLSSEQRDNVLGIMRGLSTKK